MLAPVRTLFVEDDPLDVAGTTTYLAQAAPHIALTAANSLSAAKDLLAKQTYEIIILDHTLPDGTGLDFLKFLHEIQHKAALIAVTDYGNYQLINDVLKHGAARTVVKGQGYWECLPALIEQAIEHRKQLAEERDKWSILSSIADTLDEGIVVTDSESRIVTLNKCMQEFLNVDLEGAVGRPITEFTDRIKRNSSLISRYTKPVYGPGHTLIGQLEVFGRAEPASATPPDIQELRDTLMSHISHEVKTPLTSILGFAHMLQSHPDAPIEKRQKWADFIRSKSELLTRLIDNMLDLSNLQADELPLHLLPTDLRELLRQAADEEALLVPERTFQVEIPAELPVLKLDRDRILQVFVNLLDYVEKTSPPEQPIHVLVQTQGDSVQVSVADHSRGVAAEDREKVFEPFSAAPGAGNQPGKGLWLPLARGIIEAHGGRMWLEASSEGTGNLFIIELPVR